MTPPAHRSSSRSAQKERTRTKLLQGALALLERQSLSSLSLREVTRQAGVSPAAFYRHFADMDELGLALVIQSFGTLRNMIRSARADPDTFTDVFRQSVEILVRHVHEHRPEFLFIARERFSGVLVVRQAIGHEVRLFTSELATDLARFPALDHLRTDDLQVVADLMVSTMVSIVEATLDAPVGRPEVEVEIARVAEDQLRLISLGATRWTPGRTSGATRPG